MATGTTLGRLPRANDALRVVAVAGASLAFVWLVLAAAGVSARVPGATPASVIADAMVGVTFVGAAAVATGPAGARVLFGLVGICWLAGPWLAAPTLHVGVLAIALVTYPAPRRASLPAWAIGGAGIAAAAMQAPRPLMAVLFAAVGVVAVIDGRRRGHVARYPVLAAAGFAATVATAWIVERDPSRYDPAAWSAVYEVALILIGIGYAVATRAGARAAAHIADVVLGDERASGFAGLEAVLREVLGDPTARVYRFDPATTTYRDAAGSGPQPASGLTWLPVDEAGQPVGAVEHHSALMADAAIAASVVEAVRLAALNRRHQDALDEQVAALEASRARLVAAADRQRRATAARLYAEVIGPAERAVATIDEISAAAGSVDGADIDGLTSLDVARAELSGATRDLRELVAGAPPAGLGNGGLVDAVRGLAARSPIPVTVSTSGDPRGPAQAEAALYFVCSEAITNAVKHAQCRRIDVRLEAGATSMSVAVEDDGVGGANPAGSGLTGLADRVAACNGRLRVMSSPGAGTRVVAEVRR
ncbi:MAG TPA: ATP-binding protein [Candidatus Limnocylindrales bacterium]|nr:ATP-binding protein [Candidatus Limnocylindrales bacterium]